MLREQKTPISEQTPLWPSSAMKHTQSIPTTATNHYNLGRGAAAKTAVGPQFEGKSG